MALLSPPLVLILLEALVDAGIPVEGVSVGRAEDRTTWHVVYAASATSTQHTQGDQLLATLDTADAGRITTLLDRQAVLDCTEARLQAITLALWECIRTPLLTSEQLRARIVDIYKTL